MNDRDVATTSLAVSKEDDAAEMSDPLTSLDTLLMAIEEAGGPDTVFPPLDGTAFYSMLCRINHSCDPNVMVRYSQSRESGLLAQLVALRDLIPEEELLYSYIDQSLRKYCKYVSHFHANLSRIYQHLKSEERH